jgi:hypothetical protein
MKNIHLIATDKPSRLYLDRGKLWIDNLVYGSNNQHIYITNSEDIKEGDWFINKFYIDKRAPIASQRFAMNSNAVFSNPKKIILTTDQDLIKDGVQAIDDEFLEWFVKNPSCEKVKVSELRFFEPETKWSGHCKWEYDLPQEEPKQTKWDKLNKELDDALEEAFGTSPSNILDVFENAKLVLREHLIANKEEVVKDLEQMREWSNTNKQETLEEAAEKEFPLIDTEWCRTGACEEENLHLLGHRKSFIAGAKWQANQNQEAINKLISIIEWYDDESDVRPDAETFMWFEQFKKK